MKEEAAQVLEDKVVGNLQVTARSLTRRQAALVGQTGLALLNPRTAKQVSRLAPILKDREAASREEGEGGRMAE